MPILYSDEPKLSNRPRRSVKTNLLPVLFCHRGTRILPSPISRLFPNFPADSTTIL